MAKSNMMCAPHELTHHKRCLEGAGQCDGASIPNLVTSKAQQRDRAIGLVLCQTVVTKPGRLSAAHMQSQVIARRRRAVLLSRTTARKY